MAVIQKTEILGTSVVSEASPPRNWAPASSLASAVRTCNVEYPEQRPQVNQPVLLMVREDLYAIVVALVVTNTCCTRVLTYYFVDDSMLKRNAEETRHYISESSGVAQVRPVWESDGFSEHPLATDGCRICDGLSVTVSIKDPLAARNEIRFHLGTQRASYGSISDVVLVGTNDPFPAVARKEVSDAATYAMTRQLQRLHAFCKCWRLLR
ncbi:hypothetical protein MTO96_010858 [Rhipicephalus appendiculatus]